MGEETQSERELALKERELNLRLQEFQHKKSLDERASKLQISPLTTAVVGGVLALLVSIIGGIVTTTVEQQRVKKELDIKDRDSQLQIILRATQDRTRKEAIDNLKFFVDIGLLKDQDGLIQKQLTSSSVPSITTGAKQQAPTKCALNAFGSPLRARIATVFSMQLHVDCKSLKPETRLKEDLKLDDLDVIDLSLAFDLAFGVKTETMPLRTLADYFQAIEREMVKK